MRKANILLAILNQINAYIRQQSLDGWHKAGIGKEVFKVHPSWSALSSKAEVTGVSLTDVFKEGHWS